MFFSRIQTRTSLIGSNKILTLLLVLALFQSSSISVTLLATDGTRIFQTSGIEKAYDPSQPKTVNPFLAYTPNGTVSSVSGQRCILVLI